MGRSDIRVGLVLRHRTSVENSSRVTAKHHNSFLATVSRLLVLSGRGFYRHISANSKDTQQKKFFMNQFQISIGLTRKVWEHLQSSLVPIVTTKDLKDIGAHVDEINKALRSNAYMPSIGHGYFGVEKKLGVTRFLPIIDKMDMAVYYHLCGELGDIALVNRPDIYGGWQVVPQASSIDSVGQKTRSELVSAMYQQGYFQDTLSNAAWFQGFKSFTHLLGSIINDKSEYGNFVATTDIANFYDSIDTSKLILKLRNKIPDHANHIEILQLFLNFWNRRSSGYYPSTKGIPQEIVSDASRNLSHFYLQDFDDKFSAYCNTAGLRYIRWADDMLIFGASSQKLESALHMASRMLLVDGLNLSAPKTRIMGKRQYYEYRGLGILDAINRNDLVEYRRQRDTAMREQKNGKQLKVDTIFRASLGFLSRRRRAVTKADRDFLWNTITSDPGLLGSINAQQCLSFVRLTDTPSRGFSKLLNTALLKDVAAPKASLAALIRHHSKRLVTIGISRTVQENALDALNLSSDDSQLLQHYCIPAAKEGLRR